MLLRKTDAFLTEEHLQRYTPSVFTMEKSASTSDRYQHISTIDVIRGLASEGFKPVNAVECRARSYENKPFTKHMLRFRHVDTNSTNDGLFPELVLINSHNGLSSYKLIAGLYRLICSNGLVAGETYNQIRVRHQGDIIDRVIEGTYEVMKSAPKLLEQTSAMKSIILSPQEKQIFAEAVHDIRFANDKTLAKEAIKPEYFLRPKRYAEADKHDLFTTFNITQENTIKGGLRGWARDDKGYAHRTTTRAIKSIDQSTHLNRALWSLAEKMLQLKS